MLPEMLGPNGMSTSRHGCSEQFTTSLSVTTVRRKRSFWNPNPLAQNTKGRIRVTVTGLVY